MKKVIKILVVMIFSHPIIAQNWIDSLDAHGREVYMPASKYKWDWGQGTFLNALIHLHQTKPEAEKEKYIEYIKTAMDSTYSIANGKHPNAVASGHGMAFLARMTKDKKYEQKAINIYNDFLKTPRSQDGGVSHRTETVELWDDTVYMLSMFLLEMYRLTGDDKYIADFTQQVKIHSYHLANKTSGLWLHGWDADNIDYDDKCSQVGWANKTTRQSANYWGRANGWVAMALADALSTIPKTSIHWKFLKKEFISLMEKLPALQNKTTGHWYQLLIFPNDADNFQESSCTAMFSYAMLKGMEMDILNRKNYQPVVDLAYNGLKKQSLEKVEEKPYLIPSRICGGTCIGDKDYYYRRSITTGTGFGYGSFIMFGLEYEKGK